MEKDPRETDELSEKDLDRVAGGQTIVPGSGPGLVGTGDPNGNNLTGDLPSDYDKTH